MPTAWGQVLGAGVQPWTAKARSLEEHGANMTITLGHFPQRTSISKATAESSWTHSLCPATATATWEDSHGAEKALALAQDGVQLCSSKTHAFSE